MASEYLYPLDLTGSQPSNKIRDEKHTISPPSQITQSSFVVLRACPFFAHNVVVKDGIGPTARTLAFGEDYLLTHKSIALTMHTKKPVYASIQFKDRNYTGTIYVTYQTVGGEYNLDDYTIVEKLTRQKYIINHTSFDQIVGLPASFPNPPHQHDPTDLVGMEQIVEQLSNLAAAIRGNKGSFGLVNTTINSHLTAQSAHSPAQVGLSNVKNFGLAVAADFETRAADKYTTAVVITDYVNKRLTAVDTENGLRYLTKTEANLLYIKGNSVYSKAESDNLYHNKNYLAANYLKKVDAVTVAQVGNIVNTIVDMSQYHTRTEALGVFYTRALSDARYYTRSQTDVKFVSQEQGDQRYIQTTNPEAILSARSDNQLVIEDGKFYVGKQSPLDVVNLYIDCINGSDNSPGTRSAPIRTLKRAHEMTPANKSSTWRLRHYSIDQMENANFWYFWDFNHSVKDGATRFITVYGNTWIDGAKYSEARQLANGSIVWHAVEQVSRLPIYIKTYTAPGTTYQSIYSLILDGEGSANYTGLMLIKPKPVVTGPLTSGSLNGAAYIYGRGQATFNSTWLMQIGEFGSADSAYFNWYTSYPNQEVKLLFEGCSYGYVTEIIETGVTKYKTDFVSIFSYASVYRRPFQYYYTIGTLVVSQGSNAGDGATAAGATTVYKNLHVVLQRSKMFRGLNIVNGVCTNVLTNITLVD